MPLYRATFETCKYKKFADRTFSLIGTRADGTKLFSELSHPYDWNFFNWHPRPPLPRDADSMMHTTSIEEYNPTTKKFEPIMGESY